MRRRNSIRTAGPFAAVNVLLPAAVMLTALLGGCEAVFTASFLSFLQRDPANLPAAQQAAWAEQALASGDPDAMAEAYELVKNDPANELLAAHLALELSGVPQVMSDMIQDLETVQGKSTAELRTYLETFVAGVDETYAGLAAGHFDDALTADPGQLTGQDMILGALAFAFWEAIDEAAGSFGTPAVFDQTAAFATDCLAASPDPPVDELLADLQALNS
jgi:hypothetical protein